MTHENLAEMLDAHQTELFRYLKYLGADHAAAEDLLQDAFLRAFQASSTPDLENHRARRAWLRRIAHNLFMDHCRRKARSPVAFDTAAADLAEHVWQNEFLPHDEGLGCMEALEECLRELPDRSRRIIEAFYAHRQSRSQLSDAFGISPDGVKITLRRLRQALGDCIQNRLSQA